MEQRTTRRHSQFKLRTTMILIVIASLDSLLARRWRQSKASDGSWSGAACVVLIFNFMLAYACFGLREVYRGWRLSEWNNWRKSGTAALLLVLFVVFPAISVFLLLVLGVLD